ncbi:Crp/Fnr family transcriptional regulator [Roseibium aggregatum]|uniref:Crp/Fnr family transcriptional regulator n=1 Tax=Roseibium aggregatum TaxID=187304 RepID=A0A926NX65_9HYPH|nr:Crp/Fnr family transcriptional regulator [Roseibium aggregatum]MBD1546959.1 Crp/Fnr family transcriptional regulator [Roseibium aggregatum]
MAIGLTSNDLELIRKTAILGGLGDEALTALLSDAVVKTPEHGEVLFVQGDPASAFFVVLDGWIKLYRITVAGEEAVVGIFTKGQSFAEAAAFTAGMFPVSAECVTDARLLMFPSNRLFDRIRQNPELGLSMLASTSQHLHGLVHQIQQLKAHTGAQRLAEFMLALAPVEEGACTIALPYDKALIAGHLGMKPESLSRAIARLKEVGVTVKRNMATIHDVDRLRNFFEQERAEVLRSRS